MCGCGWLSKSRNVHPKCPSCDRNLYAGEELTRDEYDNEIDDRLDAHDFWEDYYKSNPAHD